MLPLFFLFFFFSLVMQLANKFRVCHFLPYEVARTDNPGYTSIKAQLLSVPPYAAAAVITVSIGFLADRTRQRGITNMAISLIGMAGYALLIGAQGPGARYAGVFLAAMGIYPCVSNTIAWCSNNTEGRHSSSSILSAIANPSRRLQKRCHAGCRNRMGKSQRYCRLECLPRRRRTPILPRPWRNAWIPRCVLVRWIPHSVSLAGSGEPKAQARKA